MEKIHRRKNSIHQKEGEPFLSKFIDYKNLKGKTVLDIGFGVGWLTNEFQKKAKNVYGIELSKTSLNLSKYRFRKCKNVFLKLGSAEKMPFKKNFFDFVASYGVLHHAENDEVCFDEIYRVLKPGGKCFLMLYRKGGPKYWWSKIFRQGILKGGLGGPSSCLPPPWPPLFLDRSLGSLDSCKSSQGIRFCFQKRLLNSQNT